MPPGTVTGADVAVGVGTTLGDGEGDPVGSVRRHVRQAGIVRFAVRLSRPVRRALARGRRPGVRVLLLVTSGGRLASATRSVRLHL